jgi:hypothetical protein
MAAYSCKIGKGGSTLSRNIPKGSFFEVGLLMRFVAAGILATLALALAFQGDNQAGEKAKYSISEVMIQAHKSGLWKKVAEGKAEKGDREKLAELYKALTQNKPPKGDAGEWKKATEVLHKVAVEAIANPEAGKKLKVNCGACHKQFK